MTTVDDFVSSVVGAARNNGNPFVLVRDAFATALSQAPEPEARRLLLNDIDAALDRALFPAGSLPVFVALLQELRARQSEAAGAVAPAQTVSSTSAH